MGTIRTYTLGRSTVDNIGTSQMSEAGAASSRKFEKLPREKKQGESATAACLEYGDTKPFSERNHLKMATRDGKGVMLGVLNRGRIRKYLVIEREEGAGTIEEQAVRAELRYRKRLRQTAEGRDREAAERKRNRKPSLLERLCRGARRHPIAALTIAILPFALYIGC